MNEEDWKIKEEFLSSQRDCFDCHSSTIVELADGKLHAAWKGGPEAGLSNIDMKENVGVWSSAFDGNAWSEAQQIVCAPCSVCWIQFYARFLLMSFFYFTVQVLIHVERLAL